MESYILISYLNDFTFCPRSIYFHNLYGQVSEWVYHSTAQSKGRAAHKTIDSQSYSTSKNVLQGIDVYCERYNLCGKIDIYDRDKQELVERKRQIKFVYQGYIFQIYAQYFALTEMGYDVQKLKFYSMVDNKSYPVAKPEDSPEDFEAFEKCIADLRSFDLHADFTPVAAKCRGCIYHNLCDYSLADVEPTRF